MPTRRPSLAVAPADALKESDSIRDALARVGSRYGAIIVVLDDQGKLAGVVSPGDLRKAILRGNPTSAPLGAAMNRNPVSIRAADLEGTPDFGAVLDDLRRRYTNRYMMYAMIPVIDDHRRVRGLVNLESLAKYASDLELAVSHRRALVVGGAGYIGSVLARLLIADGWNVRVLDRLLYSGDSLAGLDGDKFALVRGDAMDMDAIVDAVEGVDAVIYLAELVGDPAVAIAPQTALKTNYLAVTALAQLCAYLNINRFIFTSSCSVYGASRTPAELLTEEAPVSPVSLYGKMKVLVEEAVLAMAALPNQLFAPTILRLGTVFGHSQRARFDLVVNAFVKDAVQKGRIQLFGGDQWRPQVHVGDVARAIVGVLDAPLETVGSQIFNVGATEQNYTIARLAEFAREVFPGLEVVRREAADRRDYRVNCDKISRVLGFETAVSVVAGMREIKAAIEGGAVGDLDSPAYSNYRTIQGLNFD